MTDRFFKPLGILAICIFLSFQSYAQVVVSDIDEDEKKDYFGFVVGHGDQTFVDVDYSYHVTLFQVYFIHQLFTKGSWSINFVMKPQYNLTKYKYYSQDEYSTKGYEFGQNMGFRFGRNVYKKYLSCYFTISSGPHYVSGVPERQSSGFIFSDNFILGLDIKLVKNLSLDLNYGFRHISNAAIKRPNGGVNTTIYGLGLIYRLDHN